MKSSLSLGRPVLWVALLLHLAGATPSYAQTEMAFNNATSLEDNWYHLDWFGYFMIQDTDWIYHLEHGWMYLSWGDPDGSGKVNGEYWLHDMEMGWWWISHRHYPYVYSSAHENWLWFVPGSTDPRWFYCFCNCSWESMPATTWVIPPGPPEDLIEISAGEFTMGQDLDGVHYSVPEHRVTLDAFYIGTQEVTKELWDEIYVWALCNDYVFDNLGKATSDAHPVTDINWYDVVKWCNAYSQKERRDPVYYTDDSNTVVYKTGNLDLTAPSVDWGANGYRLPTEAEWEKAARGGLAGKIYPWGDSATSDDLNYGITPGEALLGGLYAPNGYGLYDMAGNVAEWAWDWHGSYSADDQTDPTGPSSGADRVYRGGSWELSISRARCADRAESKPWASEPMIGFRLVISGD